MACVPNCGGIFFKTSHIHIHVVAQQASLAMKSQKRPEIHPMVHPTFFKELVQADKQLRQNHQMISASEMKVPEALHILFGSPALVTKEQAWGDLTR